MLIREIAKILAKACSKPWAMTSTLKKGSSSYLLAGSAAQKPEIKQTKTILFAQIITTQFWPSRKPGNDDSQSILSPSLRCNLDQNINVLLQNPRLKNGGSLFTYRVYCSGL